MTLRAAHMPVKTGKVAAKKATRQPRRQEHEASQAAARKLLRDAEHAAAILAIDAAIVVAELPSQTVPQLIAALEALHQVGVGRGGWKGLVQWLPGYGLPLQQVIARVATCPPCPSLRRAIMTIPTHVPAQR